MIKIKIIINNDMRKFKFNSKTQNYEDFLSKIRQLWKINYPETKLPSIDKLVTKYLDADKDWITFNSPEEWKELLEDMAGSPSIKISVGLKKKSIDDQLKDATAEIEPYIKELVELFTSFAKKSKNFQPKDFKGFNCGQFFKNPQTFNCKQFQGMSFDELLKNLFGQNFNNGNCQQKTDKKKDEKKETSSNANLNKKKPSVKVQLKKNVEKVDKKVEKEEIKEEKKSQKPSAPLFENQNLGNIIQSFMPHVNQAFQKYQDGVKNGQFPNFFPQQPQSQEKKDYKEERDQLKDMGFLDDKLNMTYLQKHRGDIKRVIAEYFK